MFSAMGIGGGGSLIGGLAAVLALIPFLFYKYGKQIRIRSKFAPTEVRPQPSDVENSPSSGEITDTASVKSSPSDEGQGVAGDNEK